MSKSLIIIMLLLMMVSSSHAEKAVKSGTSLPTKRELLEFIPSMSDEQIAGAASALYVTNEGFAAVTLAREYRYRLEKARAAHDNQRIERLENAYLQIIKEIMIKSPYVKIRNTSTEKNNSKNGK